MDVPNRLQVSVQSYPCSVRCDLLSIPSKSYVCTIFFALCAKTERTFLSPATRGNDALPSPPPPRERMVFSCGCLFLMDLKSFRHPLTPQRSIPVSAYSSLSCSHVSSRIRAKEAVTYKNSTIASHSMTDRSMTCT